MTLAEAYQRERREGHRAHVALAIARLKIREPEFDWSYGRGAIEGAKLERDGFEIRIKVDYDQLVDLDVTWTNREYELPDRHESVYRAPGRLVHDDDTWHRMVWKGYDHRWAYCVPTMQVAELADWYHGHDGASRSVALDRARENVRSVVEMYTDDNYAEYLIRVTASKNGVDLGSDSLGGVDLADGPYAYTFVQLEEVVADHGMIDAAIEQARETLAGLCSTTTRA